MRRQERQFQTLKVIDIYLPSHFLRQWLDDVEEGEERGVGGGKRRTIIKKKRKKEKKMTTQDIVNGRVSKRRGDGYRSTTVAPLRLEDTRELQENPHTHTHKEHLLKSDCSERRSR